jgi:hypothetical protein
VEEIWRPRNSTVVEIRSIVNRVELSVAIGSVLVVVLSSPYISPFNTEGI